MKTRKEGTRSWVLVMIFFLSCTIYKAQDRITMVDGSEINAKVIEISDTQIKYKASDYLTGPTRSVLISEVFMIKYENGRKEVFNKTGGQLSQPTDTRTYSVSSNRDTRQGDTSFVPPKNAKFGGPRFGLTYISPGTIATELEDLGKNPLLTQFGWQFEVRMFTLDKGPTGIFEFIPLIAGMEQGLFLPSGNLLIGLRGGGTMAPEFALGPNVSVVGLGMVFAAGVNFRSGNINFPVNFAYVPSSAKKVEDPITNEKVVKGTGSRFTLTVGFNMRKK